MHTSESLSGPNMSFNSERLRAIIREEAGRDIYDTDRIGDLFKKNRKGLASMLLRLEAASGEQLIMDNPTQRQIDALRRQIDFITNQTVGDVIGMAQEMHQRSFDMDSDDAMSA